MADAQGSRTLPAPSSYYYRRALSVRELMPAVGVAVGAGVVAFYLAKLMLQRTPLRAEAGMGARERRGGAARRRPPRVARR